MVRDMASDASQQAANKLRPSEEQLSQVDQPAEENTWHDKPDFAGHKEQLKSKFRKNKGVSLPCPLFSYIPKRDGMLTFAKGPCERSLWCCVGHWRPGLGGFQGNYLNQGTHEEGRWQNQRVLVGEGVS